MKILISNAFLFRFARHWYSRLGICAYSKEDNTNLTAGNGGIYIILESNKFYKILLSIEAAEYWCNLWETKPSNMNTVLSLKISS